MQKTLILGLGAFGFAVAKYLGNLHPEKHFYGYERNPEIIDGLIKTQTHPYFFEGVKLPTNIEVISNLTDILPEIDIIISIIPCQFTVSSFSEIRGILKPGVTIVNLAKGIDNSSLQTISEKLSEALDGTDYTYSYLAGGMIAAELVDEKMLGADIVCEDEKIGEELQKLFESEKLGINLKIGNPKNTELYAALKNIVALILGYYEGQGAEASTLGYYFSKLLGEITGVITLLDGDENIDFSDYALSGDLIATCFGGSRNRLLGNMLGKGNSIDKALAELKAQKKIAEGYETLKGVYKLTQGKEGFEEINRFGNTYL